MRLRVDEFSFFLFDHCKKMASSSASSDAAVLAALLAVLLAGVGVVLFVLSKSGGEKEKGQVRRKNVFFWPWPSVDAMPNVFFFRPPLSFSSLSLCFLSFPLLTPLCPFFHFSTSPQDDAAAAPPAAAGLAAGGGAQRQQPQQQQQNRRDRLGAGLARRRAAWVLTCVPCARSTARCALRKSRSFSPGACRAT